MAKMKQLTHGDLSAEDAQKRRKLDRTEKGISHPLRTLRVIYDVVEQLGSHKYPGPTPIKRIDGQSRKNYIFHHVYVDKGVLP